MVHNGSTDRIIQALKDLGCGTSLAVSKHLGVNRDKVSSLISELTHAKNRRIYICDWIREGIRRQPKAVYALGDLPNAPKPKPYSNTPEAKAAYRLKYKKQAVAVEPSALNTFQWPPRTDDDV